MTYAGPLKAPNAVKAMFGLLKRSDVERAIREARQDIYAANVADYKNSQAALVEIAKSACHRPQDHVSAKPQAPSARPTA